MADALPPMLAFQTGVELASDAILVADAGGRVVFVNPAATDLYGTTRIVGQYLDALFETSVESSQVHIARAIEGAEQQVAAAVRGNDGERRAVLVRLAPADLKQLGGAGATSGTGKELAGGVVASMRDVTDEFRARHAVAKSEARYHNVFEGASDAIYTTDLNGTFTSMNSATCRMSGCTRQELTGKSVAPFLDPAELPIILEHIGAVQSGESRHYKCHFIRADGHRLLLDVTNTPIRNMDEIIGILGIARDVTEQDRVTAEREELRRQLAQSQKLEALGQLVSGVAHELNNPLAAVMAYAQLLLNKPSLYEEERQAVDTILHETKRAARIVANLLTFARQHQPERTLADLNQVVSDTIALRRYSLTSQGIELVLDLDDTLPPTWADSFQIQQVLLNLLTNAEHALTACEAPRQLTVATRFEKEMLILRVTDSGRGIEEHVLDQIFNPFFTTKGVGMGTGLGLSVSDGIVREHGGRIRVESTPGQGASFIVELPRTEPDMETLHPYPLRSLPRRPISV